jgi:hypothetical protein
VLSLRLDHWPSKHDYRIARDNCRKETLLSFSLFYERSGSQLARRLVVDRHPVLDGRARRDVFVCAGGDIGRRKCLEPSQSRLALGAFSAGINVNVGKRINQRREKA